MTMFPRPFNASLIQMDFEIRLSHDHYGQSVVAIIPFFSQKMAVSTLAATMTTDAAALNHKQQSPPLRKSALLRAGQASLLA